MPKEKEKEAAAVRTNMAKLRSNGLASHQEKISFHQLGRGGGRLNRGLGRGGGGMVRTALSSQPKITSLFVILNNNITNMSSTTVVTTGTTDQSETNTMSLNHITVSNLMEQTTETRANNRYNKATQLMTAMQEDDEQEEEEEEDGMTPMSLMATPNTILTFQANKQRIKDVEEGLPKSRYGIEFQNELSKESIGQDKIPDYIYKHGSYKSYNFLYDYHTNCLRYHSFCP
jgi:hypothetical protein